MVASRDWFHDYPKNCLEWSSVCCFPLVTDKVLSCWHSSPSQIEHERKELYDHFVAVVGEVQQRSELRNIVLEKKLNQVSYLCLWCMAMFGSLLMSHICILQLFMNFIVRENGIYINKYSCLINVDSCHVFFCCTFVHYSNHKCLQVSDNLEKKEAVLSEVLTAANLDPVSFNQVSHQLEVCYLSLFLNFSFW